MNRIERLIWEETQLKEMERMRRDSPGIVGGKFLFIAIVVGLLVILASRVAMLTLDDAVVRALVPTSVFYTPAAASSLARKGGVSAGTTSRVAADAADGRGDRPVAPSGR